jgi:exodeoxyribonuclease VII small subunit
MAADLPFEKALEKLEKIVQDLETGDISLDDALKKYEEGIKLSRACQQKLAQAEKKIEILIKTPSGTLKKEAFAAEEAAECEEDSSPKRKTAAKSRPDTATDEDLLI